MGISGLEGVSKFSILLDDPDGKNMMKIEGQFETREKDAVNTVVAGPLVFPLSMKGVYQCIVVIEGKEYDRYPLRVIYAIDDPPRLSSEEIAVALLQGQTQ